MSEYRATTLWTRTSSDFTYDSYNRGHEVRTGGGQIIPWSSAPEYKGERERVNPEEALVAALSTCHMLTFLAIAARKQFTVDHYRDEAVGIMTKNDHGKFWVSQVTLRPEIVFGGTRQPSLQELAGMHHSAHENCFIANSVKTSVVIEG
ncbi:MAG TPA: osmotically inducible protein OsmC [Alphaproteobacteria bacterium]|nr:osmotically inducible protein OsmC [Alphaproteobacteria bacterium]HAJ47810.1 osmotically inducible protein OsmC [Alphaproteobacteria bacterium]